ncbi:MAG TPA: hypothetical protein VFP32_00665 [Candidatus Saccharimonadales bacterium]|nr:hypothetical protein [Candidatus Saccharimonadales bacterium]
MNKTPGKIKPPLRNIEGIRRIPKQPPPVRTLKARLKSLKLELDTKGLIAAIHRVSRRIWIGIGSLALAIILSVVFYQLFSGPGSTQAEATGRPSSPPVLERGTPSFSTILPSGKSIASLGGWARVSPPDRDPVYAYADKINNIQIDVSEQPLPDNFKNNTDDKIQQLAQGFNATDKITAQDITVYIGTSSKGPQSVIFTEHGLLILIKSNSMLSNNQWIAYISSMK